MTFRVCMLTILTSLSLTHTSSTALACGGFFCQLVPVNQAAEQIVFHQEGEDITAMVRILYQGDAEEFSWVVPVPNTPELSTGTGREGDVVISANTEIPFGAPPVAVNEQLPIQLVEDTSADAAPNVTVQPQFTTLRINSDGSTEEPTLAGNDDDDGFLGLGSLSLYWLFLTALFAGLLRRKVWT